MVKNLTLHQLCQNVGEDNLRRVTKFKNLTLHQLRQNMGEDDQDLH